MQKNSIKTVVAIGIGAALFFVLGRFVAIPSGIPNTNITLQYAILALLAVMYGPVAGGLIGFIGHTLIDLSWGGSPWWSWVIASAFVGVVVGLFANKIKLNEGNFGKKEIITFAIANIVANVIAWVGVAPVLDILIYAEPANKVFAQGATAAAINSIAAVVVGALLCIAYSKTIAKKGSLDKE
ncbi:MAG: ECF-type riboflavin transporter substrate-binding protein [Clostridia bacterium]|nr:ECF-type riboflavin transporter substrate-binding protein [Clostridia bacterium]MBR3874155.1 ECF-type riboflavin transporter substrate-binding protein [Clostridia bacterium]